jgi:phosphatidylethanolamine-binding protein (PEBP) family uncharacterized protein
LIPSKYKSAENVAELTVSFIDQKWDGRNVPKNGQCRNCGGEGLSPPLLVKNIPENTDALIVEFNDKTMPTFHGAIRFQVSEKAEFAIPSVQEQTFDLPQGAEMESEHDAPIGIPGAYMAPCGCGYRNKYVATIVAIKYEKSGQKLLLGKGKIKLGRF